MTSFCCPICRQPLKQKENSLYCLRNHCFDIAKSGYVNLLPSNRMHSKLPGDNKLMVQGRNAFLNKGYYAPLLQALQTFIGAAVLRYRESCKDGGFTLLDAGCGEGYYTAGMAEAIAEKKIPFTVLGVDISKAALNYAAKRTKQPFFAVGSVFDLPVADESCDMLTEIFAPFCREEFYRVLKTGGELLLVIPAPDHLFELKAAIYENPYRNEPKPYELEGFHFEGKDKVKAAITLNSSVDIQNLFTMTPYSYKTSQEDTARLMALERLTTTVHFELLHYRK